MKISKSAMKDGIDYLNIQVGRIVQKQKLYKTIKMASSPYKEQLEEDGYLCIIQIIKVDIASIKL